MSHNHTSVPDTPTRPRTLQQSQERNARQMNTPNHCKLPASAQQVSPSRPSSYNLERQSQRDDDPFILIDPQSFFSPGERHSMGGATPRFSQHRPVNLLPHHHTTPCATAPTMSSAMRYAVGADKTVSTTPSTARSTMVSQSISHIGQRLAAFHVSPRRPAATQGNYIYILILCLNIDLLFYLGSSSNRSLAQNARRRNESSSASQTSQDSQRRPVWQQSEFIKLCVCVA